MRALKEYVMGMEAVLVQTTIHALFMDVTERNAVSVAQLVTSWAFVIKTEIAKLIRISNSVMVFSTLINLKY